MNSRQGSTDQHALSARQHQEAARRHLEVSRHYRSGKDYAHAAHQALLAHGYTMRAVDSGRDARQSRHDGDAPPGSRELYSEIQSRGPTQSRGQINKAASYAKADAAEHHVAAAEQHELAAKHHQQAAEHFAQSNLAKATLDAQLAGGYAHRSAFHSDEAAKHHTEHYGQAGPSAELA